MINEPLVTWNIREQMTVSVVLKHKAIKILIFYKKCGARGANLEAEFTQYSALIFFLKALMILIVLSFLLFYTSQWL